MNQGKLEVVKQEMARVNIDILGISKLKWTGKGEFNSDDHYIYYCGKESLRRNGVAIMVHKRHRNAVLGCNLKNDRMISVQIPYDYTVEVRNRFKGLDLIECLMNYGRRFATLCRRQGSRPSQWKRNAKKQNGCLGRPYK